MSQGDLSHAMTIMSHDELAILAQEMDTLRITLASNYQNEARIKEAHQEMITCLSHDLRTPLTALRGYLDILCFSGHKGLLGNSGVGGFLFGSIYRNRTFNKWWNRNGLF